MSEEAAPARILPHARTGITGQLTREAFAALVADLRAELAGCKPVDRDRLLSRQVRPQSFTGRPWIWQAITLAEAAQLTGLALTTLRRYSKPSDRVRPQGGRNPLMPPPLGALPAAGVAQTPPNVWDAGAVALWRAGVPEVAPALGRRNPPAAHPKDMRLWSQTLPRRQFAVLAFLRAVIREDTAINVGPALEKLAASGLDTAGVNLRWFYVQARRAEARTFIERLRFECTRDDGLVTVPHVGRVYGVHRWPLHLALQRGDLVLAGRRDNGWPLLNPARLRMQGNKPGGPTTRPGVRKGLGRIPVDMDAPNALPLPLRVTETAQHVLHVRMRNGGCVRAKERGGDGEQSIQVATRDQHLLGCTTLCGEAFYLSFRVGDCASAGCVGHKASFSLLPSSGFTSGSSSQMHSRSGSRHHGQILSRSVTPPRAQRRQERLCGVPADLQGGADHVGSRWPDARGQVRMWLDRFKVRVGFKQIGEVGQR